MVTGAVSRLDAASSLTALTGPFQLVRCLGSQQKSPCYHWPKSLISKRRSLSSFICKFTAGTGQCVRSPAKRTTSTVTGHDGVLCCCRGCSLAGDRRCARLLRLLQAIGRADP